MTSIHLQKYKLNIMLILGISLGMFSLDILYRNRRQNSETFISKGARSHIGFCGLVGFGHLSYL